jgi:outer membrane protein
VGFLAVGQNRITALRKRKAIWLKPGSRRTELLDNIQRQVKQAWLKADEFEKNIVTVQSAIAQAREGFRISEALFKEQMATSTDVLDARTQLSETMTRYYNALYDFQIALAALDRAMGEPSIDIAEAQ